MFNSNGMHIRTRLANGRIGLLVDPGAFDNLCSTGWLMQFVQANTGIANLATWWRLPKSLGVEGVGQSAQTVKNGVVQLIGLDAEPGLSTYTSPVLENSHVPGLLGLKTLEDKESVLDCRRTERKLYCGPVQIIPLEGCIVHQLEPSPSGHLILPCDNFNKDKNTPKTMFHTR